MSSTYVENRKGVLPICWSRHPGIPPIKSWHKSWIIISLQFIQYLWLQRVPM